MHPAATTFLSAGSVGTPPIAGWFRIRLPLHGGPSWSRPDRLVGYLRARPRPIHAGNVRHRPISARLTGAQHAEAPALMRGEAERLAAARLTVRSALGLACRRQPRQPSCSPARRPISPHHVLIVLPLLANDPARRPDADRAGLPGVQRALSVDRQFPEIRRWRRRPIASFTCMRRCPTRRRAPKRWDDARIVVRRAIRQPDQRRAGRASRRRCWWRRPKSDQAS